MLDIRFRPPWLRKTPVGRCAERTSRRHVLTGRVIIGKACLIRVSWSGRVVKEAGWKTLGPPLTFNDGAAASTAIDPRSKGTYNIMSTILRTLRNLRSIGLKVHGLRLAGVELC